MEAPNKLAEEIGLAELGLPGEERVLPGSALVPDLANAQQGGVEREFFYWVGVTPKCPVEHINLAGINFPKLNERLVPNANRSGTMQRIPVIGAITILTRRKVELMAERLPRTVIRFIDSPGVKEEPGTGLNLGDLHERPRKGHIITIPTDEELEARRAAGRSARPYVPRKGDEPAACYMFAVLCANQDKPEHGDYYPDTLDITGLEWPHE